MGGITIKNQKSKIKNSLRLLMLGTGPFAVPTFKALYGTPHHVVGLITRPPRPVHGRSAPVVNPMRQVAEELGTEVFAPEDVNAAESRAALARYAPDLLIVCDYGQILLPETLAVAPLGGINLHASLLPKYRGAAPINWALYHGETETGVTVIHMTPRIDAGPALAQASVSIEPEETAPELEQRLAELGAPLVCQAIDDLLAGRATPLKQDPAQATRAPRLKKTDGQVDWSRPATAIKNQVRALEPWPKTYTYWLRTDGEPLRLILGKVLVLASAAAEPPGTVLEPGLNKLLIATGEGALMIEQLQPAGKRMLSADEFRRGYPVRARHQLGSAE